MDPEKFLEMKVTGLTIDPFTSMPIIILKDIGEKCALPIWIGLIEASAIATELEHIQLTRPMTHDLLKNILESLGAKVRRVAVHDLADNTFYASIVIARESEEFVMDARPSDAIAVALRARAPILVNEVLMHEPPEQEEEAPTAPPTSPEPPREPNEEEQAERLRRMLEKLDPEDFGKFSM
jgi:hypothetical protein